MKYLILIVSLFLVSCKEEPTKVRKEVKQDTQVEPYSSFGEELKDYSYKFIATEHNTFECSVTPGENTYIVKSEPGSELIMKNGIVQITDSESERWTYINPVCLFVEREGWK